MVILLGLGAFLGIKNDSKPMDEEGDQKWKTVRTVKWIFTIAVVILLLLHFKLHDLALLIQFDILSFDVSTDNQSYHTRHF